MVTGIKVKRWTEAGITLGSDSNGVLAADVYGLGQEMAISAVPRHASLKSAHLVNGRLVMTFVWDEEYS